MCGVCGCGKGETRIEAGDGQKLKATISTSRAWA